MSLLTLWLSLFSLLFRNRANNRRKSGGTFRRTQLVKFLYAFQALVLNNFWLIIYALHHLQDIRQKLEDTLPGTGGGKEPTWPDGCQNIVHSPILPAGIWLLPIMFSGYTLFLHPDSYFLWNINIGTWFWTVLVFTFHHIMFLTDKYKSEEPLPSYSVVGSSSAFGISNQRVSPLLHLQISISTWNLDAAGCCLL